MLNTLIWAQRKQIIMELNWWRYTLNNDNWFVVQNNNYTRYESSRDKIDTINSIIISPSIISNISNVNSEPDIPSDNSMYNDYNSKIRKK